MKKLKVVKKVAKKKKKTVAKKATKKKVVKRKTLVEQVDDDRFTINFEKLHNDLYGNTANNPYGI